MSPARKRAALDAALAAIVAAGLAHLAWSWLLRPESGESGPGAEPPRASFARNADGVLRASFAIVEVSSFLAGLGVPAPASGLSNVDAGVAGNLQQAFAEVREDPTAAAPARLGRLFAFLELDATARGLFLEAQRRDPRDHRWPHLAGWVAERSGAAGDAEAGYRRAVELRPDHGPSVLRLALCSLRAGRLDEAEPLLARAGQLAPGLALPRAELGRLALLRGERHQAVRHLLDAVAVEPGAGRAHQLLAQVLAELGRHELAGRHAALARTTSGDAPGVPDPLVDEIDELSGSLWQLRRRAQSEFSSGSWHALAATMEEVLSRDPTHAEERMQLGFAYSGIGRPDDGVRAIDEAISREPGNPRLYQGRAFVAWRQGEHAAAVRWADEAILRDSAMARPHLLRALSLEALGRPAAATASALRAAELEPGERGAAATLVPLLARAGELDRAAKVLEAALDRHPGAPELEALLVQVRAASSATRTDP